MMLWIQDWQTPQIRQILLFYQQHLSFLDIVIVLFGTFLLLFQLNMFVFNTSKSYFRKAQRIPLYTKKQTIYLSYLSGSIEVLPFLGILGTVFGLMNALYTLKTETNPTIGVMATAIAPALSTTLLGLIFAILNLFLFNILNSYLEELSVRFSLAYNEYVSTTLLSKGDLLGATEKEKLRLTLNIPVEARVYDDSILNLIERVSKNAHQELQSPKSSATTRSLVSESGGGNTKQKKKGLA